MLPGRHGADVFDELRLHALPHDQEWDGSIAYLDRDGVLNVGSPDYINNVDELEVMTGVPQAVGDLRRAGFRICVVTNQSPIGRGLWTDKRLEMIHDELQARLLEVDDDAILDLILYSPHVPWAGSPFRKPEPGMLMAGRQLLQSSGSIESFSGNANFNEARSALVGDRRSDLRAGKRYGVRVFHSPEHIGLPAVLSRVLDADDEGDDIMSAPV